MLCWGLDEDENENQKMRMRLRMRIRMRILMGKFEGDYSTTTAAERGYEIDNGGLEVST